MAKTVNEMLRIASAGGGFVLDATDVSTTDLVRIATAAGAKEASLIVTNAWARPTDELIRIAVAGRGNVVFQS